jgi:hypothetical protein
LGYSQNPAVLEDFLREVDLTDMKLGLPCAWETEPGEASGFAYRLRQALFIASLYPHDYPELAEAHAKYRVSVPSAHRVEAIASQVRKVTVARVGRELVGVQHGGAEPFGKPSAEVGLTKAEGVIASWQARGNFADPLVIKQHRLEYNELVKLYYWAKERGLMMLEAAGMLTLAKKEISVMPHAWRPREEPLPEEKFDL